MKRKASRLFSSLLALCLVLALLPSAAYATWGFFFPVYGNLDLSYLYENAHGGLTRVHNIATPSGTFAVEDYDSSFRLLSKQTFPRELDKWGGFFYGETWNFVVFGQENPEEDNSKEVIRVVKYSKDWQRLGQASLYGANTQKPFYFGSLRFAEHDGELYIRTCHAMYTSSDGLNHQANMTIAVRESDMKVTDSFYEVGNSNWGYVSHSFDQYVIVDQQRRIVTLDHGDAYPRAAVLMVYDTKAGQGKFSGSVSSAIIQSFPGAIGDNETGAVLGGLAETAGGYVVGYSYDGAGRSTDREYSSVYFAYVDKDSLRVETKKLADAPASQPYLAPTGLNGGYILWEGEAGSNTVYYAAYSDGGSVGEVKTAPGGLGWQPILYNGKVVWHVNGYARSTFYVLDENGLTATEVETPDYTSPSADTPAPDGISVTVNGAAVPFTDAAPFIDENDRTMVPLRAVGDAMGLDVNWDGNAREASFTNGRKTIYFPIDSSAARTSDGGTVQMDTAAVIVNERTYAPIRYLAEYFGYTVGWDAATKTVSVTG